MKYFRKIGNEWDSSPVVEELASQPLLWGKSPRVTFPGSPHQEIRDIILRGPINYHTATVQELWAELQCEDYPAAEILPCTRRIAGNLAYLLSSDEEREFGGLQLGRVLLTRLAPNKTIHPHRDEGPVPEFYRRIHMVVQGGDNNIFMIGGDVQPMLNKEMWECDVREMHTVINLMEIDRIHLIVDIER